MLKTVTAFKLDFNTREYLRLLGDDEFLPVIEDPDKTAWRSVGFASPDAFDGKPRLTTDGITVLLMEVRERILPGKVIRTKLAEVIADMESREGRRIGRKERAGVKDELVAKLLPTALIKPSHTFIVLCRDWLLIGSGSSRTVDTALDLIRNLSDIKFGIMPITSLVEQSPMSYMVDILINGTTPSGYLDRGDAVMMKSAEKAVARFKGMGLGAEAVKDRIAVGFMPTELAVSLEDKMLFTMTDHLVLKRIMFSDVISEQISEMVGEDDHQTTNFEATAIITVKPICDLLDTLLTKEEMGNIDPDEEL